MFAELQKKCQRKKKFGINVIKGKGRTEEGIDGQVKEV